MGPYASKGLKGVDMKSFKEVWTWSLRFSPCTEGKHKRFPLNIMIYRLQKCFEPVIFPFYRFWLILILDGVTVGGKLVDQESVLVVCSFELWSEPEELAGVTFARLLQGSNSITSCLNFGIAIV